MTHCPLPSLPLAPASYNSFSFQQHSRIIGLSTFIFRNIPASRASFPQRSFVFNNIPAPFVQKRILSELPPTVKSLWLTEDACQQIIFPDAGDFSSPGHAKALRRMWSLRAFPAVIVRYQASSQSATCQALIIESIPDHPAAPQRAAKTVSQTCWDRGSLKP